MYLALMEGEDPETTRPVLMTRDPTVLRALADALATRLQDAAESNERNRAAADVLDLVRDDAGGDQGGAGDG